MKEWLKRKITQPILNQLYQGANPKDLAISCAVGVACGTLPFMGFTTLVGFLIGYFGRLNQPALQIVNYLMTPIHLMSIVIYAFLAAHLGTTISVDITPTAILAKFHEGLGPFFEMYGWLGFRALILWLILSPIYSFVVYFFLRKAFIRFMKKEVIHEERT